tara:strand:- start:508 stop:765 length:258 start_codon:yes stop_codon:yes gene_type:complete
MDYGLTQTKPLTSNAMVFATKIKKQLTLFKGTFHIFQPVETWKPKLFLSTPPMLMKLRNLISIPYMEPSRQWLRKNGSKQLEKEP